MSYENQTRWVPTDVTVIWRDGEVWRKPHGQEWRQEPPIPPLPDSDQKDRDEK